MAAGIHALVCPEHFREGLRFGLFFLFIALVQLALGGLVLRGAPRWIGWSIVVNAGTALLWAVVRTQGLPLGLAEVEPIGRIDLAATAAEVVAVAAGLLLLARRRPPVAVA